MLQQASNRCGAGTTPNRLSMSPESKHGSMVEIVDQFESKRALKFKRIYGNSRRFRNRHDSFTFSKTFTTRFASISTRSIRGDIACKPFSVLSESSVRLVRRCYSHASSSALTPLRFLSPANGRSRPATPVRNAIRRSPISIAVMSNNSKSRGLTAMATIDPVGPIHSRAPRFKHRRLLSIID